MLSRGRTFRDVKPQIDDVAQGYSKVRESDVSEHFLTLCQTWLQMYWSINQSGSQGERFENVQHEIFSLIMDGRMNHWLTGITTGISIENPYCLYFPGIRSNAKTVQCQICHAPVPNELSLGYHLVENHLEALATSYRL